MYPQLDTQFNETIQHIIDTKTKPVGSLGQLEKVAFQLALIQSQGKESATTSITLNKPTMLVFAGDHGIAAEGVSIAPSEVTQQMVMNFLAGGAAINCFCRVSDIELHVVDAGILAPLATPESFPLSDSYHEQRLGSGTANIAKQAAMTIDDVKQGLKYGANIVEHCVNQGSNFLMFGEMGIANTSSATALLSAVTQHPVAECVGVGTGITDEQLIKKTQLIEQGVERFLSLHDRANTEQALAELGGYEIVQMVGAFIAARKKNVPVLVDGFIVSVAALVATSLDASSRETMIFAHHSKEAGHVRALNALQATPLIDLELRLGEGTGAALAFPLVKAAAEFYNEMASFESAGVTV
ncbi:nicotinate-nucleotide--dimethylbenzimidazole phosphoribosyltransferase [Vibrio tapetis]|uniref:Nicotinate-nucleotide--dimethylbenzimidazole phosphoribosyltransferase n=1 Tax=Vibrio tapetis subsp. tapetis TaxID=1671868 RepID=A0A2N8Z994_9VIBR|nr:nicotinate-nucleotide--dimethylbenzimidazole phosphoribosyltransferase [Vibrio tapetis]SON48481.1 Nicotinate-nucleotide--dimethylbenzimidazole phosphoribosyltransferase [Vibrio tapetis subsp. tapetis]